MYSEGVQRRFTAKVYNEVYNEVYSSRSAGCRLRLHRLNDKKTRTNARAWTARADRVAGVPRIVVATRADGRSVAALLVSRVVPPLDAR